MRIKILMQRKGWEKTPTGRRRKKLLEQLEKKKLETPVEAKSELKENVFGWRSSKRWRRSFHTTYRRFGQDIWGSISLRQLSNRVALQSWKFFFNCTLRERFLCYTYGTFVELLLKKFGNVFGIPPLFWRLSHLYRNRSLTRAYKVFRNIRKKPPYFLRKVVNKTFRMKRFRFDFFNLLLRKYEFKTLLHRVFTRSIRRRIALKWKWMKRYRLPFIKICRGKSLPKNSKSGLYHNFFVRLSLFKTDLNNKIRSVCFKKISSSRLFSKFVLWSGGQRVKYGRVSHYWRRIFSPWQERIDRWRYDIRLLPPLFLERANKIGFLSFMLLNAEGDGTTGMFGEEVVRQPKRYYGKPIPFAFLENKVANVHVPRGHKNKVSRMLKRHQLFYGNLTLQEHIRFAEKHVRIKRSVSILYSMLERRLDVLLVRALFFRNVFEAQVMIRMGKICVNGISISIPGFVIKPMDIITITKLYRIDLQKRILANLLNDRVLDRPPFYLLLDYRMPAICYLPLPDLAQENSFPSEAFRDFGRY